MTRLQPISIFASKRPALFAGLYTLVRVRHNRGS